MKTEVGTETRNNGRATDVCCGRFYFVDFEGGRNPRVILECSVCGRLWYRNGAKTLEPYTVNPSELPHTNG